MRCFLTRDPEDSLQQGNLYIAPGSVLNAECARAQKIVGLASCCLRALGLREERDSLCPLWRAN